MSETRQREIRSIVVALAILYAWGWNTAYAEDWPNWRGPDHNGISRETGWDANRLKDPPEILWRKQIGSGFSAVSVSNGRAYAMGNTGDQDDLLSRDSGPPPKGDKSSAQTDILWCLDAATGKEIWRHAYPCPLEPKSHEGGPSATPAAHAGKVYSLSKQGHVFCLNAQDGAVVWRKHLTDDFGLKPHEWGFSCSPMVVDDLIVFNAGTYGLALRKQDGAQAWLNGKGVPGYSSAVPYQQQGKKCVAILGHKELYGVVAATGQVQWNQPWETRYDENIPDAVIAGDRLFMSSGLGTGAALFRIEADKLVRLWSHKEMQSWMSTCVLWQDHIYGMDSKDKALKCLDFPTGTVKWTQKGFGLGSLMLAADKLIILSDKGRLVIAPAVPTGYTELAAAEILEGKCWTMPVLAQGRIYARNADGTLVCVDVSGRK